MIQVTVTFFISIIGIMLGIKVLNFIGQILADLIQKLVQISGTVILLGGLWFLMNIML